MKHSRDFYEAGMTAWNTLTLLIDGVPQSFKEDQMDEFVIFYDTIIEKLLSEEEQE